MADEKVTAMTPQSAIDPTDLLHTIDDVAGVPDNLSLELSLLLGGSQMIGGNLIKNSPGQIAVDGAEPQWWDDVANATITDEDAAGEGIEEKQERVFRVVSSTADVYGYQTLTFADEDLLDAGETVVSFGAWVWCASASAASIGIYGTNLTLQESGQHSGGSSWEYFSVENKTLHAADASIEARFIVDSGTAYYCLPMLVPGPIARTWMPRLQKFVATAKVNQYDLNTTGDVAWSDTDCTANTHPLATGIAVKVYADEADGVAGSFHQVGHSDDLTGGDAGYGDARISVVGISASSPVERIACNDSQVVRYRVTEQDADADVRAVFEIHGYWKWA